MPSLTLSEIPGWTDIAAEAFGTGSALTEAVMQALLGAVKFAAVRNETFWGFYQHSEQVTLPVSPIDGYEYARNELHYVWCVYSSAAGPGSLQGTQGAPTPGATSGGGQVLSTGAFVDPATGNVTCQTQYYASGGSTTATNDGIVMVITLAQRMRAS